MLAGISFAQEDFRAGVIIENGIEREVLIEFRSERYNHYVCRFKADARSEASTLLPENIDGYYFKDWKRYRSYDVAEAGRKGFFEVIADGNLELLVLDGEYYYGFDSKAYKLVFGSTQLTLRVGSNSYDVSDILGDCSRSISARSPNSKALIKSVRSFNTCEGSETIVYRTEVGKVILSTALIVGMNSTFSSLSTEDRILEHLNLKYSPGFSPVIGASLDVNVPEFARRLSGTVSALYTTGSYSFYELRDLQTSIIYEESTFDFTAVMVPVGVKYNYPLGQIIVIPEAGAAGNILLNSDLFWLSEEESNNTVETTLTSSTSTLKKHVGFWAGISVAKYLKSRVQLQLGLRYFNLSGAFEDDEELRNLNSKLSTFQVYLALRR